MENLTKNQIDWMRDLPLSDVGATGIGGREITALVDAGFVERDTFAAMDPPLIYRRTYLGSAMIGAIDFTRAEVFAEVDAAIAQIVGAGGSPVEFSEYEPGSGIVCCEDERVAGKFSLAGFSYVACLLQSALEEATPENRDHISDRNIALLEEARAVTK